MCSSQNKLLQSWCIIRNRGDIMDIKRQIINQFFYWLRTSVTSSTVVPLYIATLSTMKMWSNKRNDLSKRGTIWYCFTISVHLKTGLIRGSDLWWEWTYKRCDHSWGCNLVVFYYFNASEIWPNKKGGLWWEWFYKRGRVVSDGSGFIREGGWPLMGEAL